ncbi:MAG: sn-glycerol-3-phosphate ABC transporter ATP-binding protein UgpC [Desulfobacterales bacterium]|jgi:multiple sugar transport system ATP-binding protein
MAEVILEHVNKTFGKTTAVRDFSLNIADGEFVVLVGPSGCGKSTTLRLIAGLEVISSGEIYIGDRLVNDVHPRDRDISMVFQNYALYPQMTVYDNMSFSLKMRKVPKIEIDRIIRQTADLLRIDQLLDRKPRQLSGGQRQRVALGRSIVRDPHVFLFDEPLSNLDAKLRIAMRAELLELHQRLKTTIIYVTHDQLEAMTMGDRIVVMKDGIIQQVDTPDTVYNHPINKFVGGFIGSPSMNFVNCIIVRKNGGFYATSAGFSLKIPERFAQMAETYRDCDVILGIRPEHLTDSASCQNPEPDSSLRALIRVIESAGSEKLVHIRNHDDTLVARLDPHVQLKTGDIVDFTARMESVHIFDMETGNTIF